MKDRATGLRVNVNVNIKQFKQAPKIAIDTFESLHCSKSNSAGKLCGFIKQKMLCVGVKNAH